jgi:galactokinase
VVTENQRVRDFAEALARHDLTDAGSILTAGHRSLAEDYGTSNVAMDDAVRDILREPGVLGARMTGGGFGGCIVALRLR